MRNARSTTRPGRTGSIPHVAWIAVALAGALPRSRSTGTDDPSDADDAVYFDEAIGRATVR